MLKRACLILLISFACLRLTAAVNVVQNSNFTDILKIEDKSQQNRNLVRYILSFFRSKPLDSLAAGKKQIKALLTQYEVDNKEALAYFVDFAQEQRLLKIDEAEDALVNAIKLATRAQDHSLLFSFYSELGFLQTYMGNTSSATYSFSIAKKQAIILDNPTLMVIVDVNISDIFYKNSLYKQSLSYLEQARRTITDRSVTEDRLKYTIYNNIAENYFRMNTLDSLKHYNALLHGLKDDSYKKYIYTNRTDYFILLLQHNYQAAINKIIALKTDPLYFYDTSDEQNLADAYFNAGMLDSSKQVINRLLIDPKEKNHPEVKYHLYEILGKIAEKKNDTKAAAFNFKMALAQSEAQINNLTQVDVVASQIKIDEAQGSFNKKEEGYKKERLGLIYVLIICMLTVAVIAMIFNVTRQKRYYEKLFFNSQKKELSFINSHEVRRHLSNILGLIDLIKNSDDKHKQYLEAEDLIMSSAKKLDGAIKTISEKLEHDDDL